jgi:hypothetical protein
MYIFVFITVIDVIGEDEFGGKFKSKTNKKVAKDQYYRFYMIANKPSLLKYLVHTHSCRKILIKLKWVFLINGLWWVLQHEYIRLQWVAALQAQAPMPL